MPDDEPRCAQCRGPIPPDGPSEDFCGEDCARWWTQKRASSPPTSSFALLHGVEGTYIAPVEMETGLAALCGWEQVMVTADRIENGVINAATITENVISIDGFTLWTE